MSRANAPTATAITGNALRYGVISAEPRRMKSRVAWGRTDRYHQPDRARNGRETTAQATQVRTTRSRAAASLTRTAVTNPNSPASMKAKKDRNTRDGQNDGLNMPSQKSLVVAQAPGVSMTPMMPFMVKSDSQAKMKYSQPTRMWSRAAIFPKE